MSSGASSRVTRFGPRREAETYELVLALSARFTRRPRSLPDTIAVRYRSFCCEQIHLFTYSRLYQWRHTSACTPIRPARYTSDTGDYRVITRRFDYGLPARVFPCRRSWKVSTHASAETAEPPWCSISPPVPSHRSTVHLCVRTRSILHRWRIGSRVKGRE